MFGFLGFILIFILIIVLIAFALLGNLVRFIFGLGKKTPKQNNHTRTNMNGNFSHQQTETSNKAPSGKKKIFTEDEGEYVEFEEVK